MDPAFGSVAVKDVQYMSKFPKCIGCLGVGDAGPAPKRGAAIHIGVPLPELTIPATIQTPAGWTAEYTGFVCYNLISVMAAIQSSEGS